MNDADDISPQSDPAIVTTVHTLLAAAGLTPTAEEVAAPVAPYPAHRAGVEVLSSLPELRYESLALTFTATPVFSGWGEPG